MRKSKLESYESILEVLVNNPSTLEHIAYEANMHCVLLKQHLDFLVKNRLLEERQLNEKTLYAITEKGIAVLKILNFQKYFGKITGEVRVIDEALEIIRKLEKKGMGNES